MSGVISSKKKSRPTATRGLEDHDNDSSSHGVVSFRDLITTDRLTADLNIFKVRHDLRKGELGILNRLKSIVVDVERFRQFRTLFPSLPVFANLRCGKWYVPPSLDPCVSSSDMPTPALVDCYFKSTDGHPGTWALSWSRANTHVIQHASTPTFVKIWPEVLYTLKARNQLPSTQAPPDPPESLLHCSLPLRGAMIVDATRKGKRFPDSFSRTIPIWCAAATVAIATMSGACACSCDGTGVIQSKASAVEGCSGAAAAAPSSTPSCLATPCPCLAALSRALHLPPWVSPSERDMVLRALPRLAALFARHTRAQRQQLCAAAACEVLPPALQPASMLETTSAPMSALASKTPASTVASPAPSSHLFPSPPPSPSASASSSSSSLSSPSLISPISPLLHPSSPLWRSRPLRPVWLQAQDARGTVAALNDNLLRWLELAVAHSLAARMSVRADAEWDAGAAAQERASAGESTSTSTSTSPSSSCPRWCVAPRPPAPVLSAAMAVLRRVVARHSLGALFPVDHRHFHRLRRAVRDLGREYSPVDDSAQSATESVDAIAVCAAVVDMLGALSLLDWSALVLYSASVPEAEGGTNGSVHADSHAYAHYTHGAQTHTTRAATAAGVGTSKGRIGAAAAETDSDAEAEAEAEVDGEADIFARAYIDPFSRAATAAASSVSSHAHAHVHTHNALLQQAMARLRRERHAHQHCAQPAHDFCAQPGAGEVGDSAERSVCGCARRDGHDAATPAGECSVECANTPIHSPLHAQGRDSWTYVQGAGDDEESWAAQLTPALLWRRAEGLLGARDNEECLERVGAVLGEGGGDAGVSMGTDVCAGVSVGAEVNAHVCALPAEVMWGVAPAAAATVTATTTGHVPTSPSAPVRVWPRVWVCEHAHVAEAAAVAAAAVAQSRANSDTSDSSHKITSSDCGPGQDGASVGVSVRGDGGARVRVFLCGEDVNAGWAYHRPGADTRTRARTHTHTHTRTHTHTHAGTGAPAEVAAQHIIGTVADVPIASPPEDTVADTVADTASLFAHACSAPVLCCGAPVGGSKKTKLGLVKHAGLLMAAAALAPAPAATSPVDHGGMTDSSRPEFFVVVCDSMEVGVAVATLISLAATAGLGTCSDADPDVDTNRAISTPLWAHARAHDSSLQPLLQLVYGCGRDASAAMPMLLATTVAAPATVAAKVTGAAVVPASVAAAGVSGVDEANAIRNTHEDAMFGTNLLVSIPYEAPGTTTHPRMRYNKDEVRQRVSAVLASTGGDVFPARTLAQQLNRVFCSAL